MAWLLMAETGEPFALWKLCPVTQLDGGAPDSALRSRRF